MISAERMKSVRTALLTVFSLKLGAGFCCSHFQVGSGVASSEWALKR